MIQTSNDYKERINREYQAKLSIVFTDGTTEEVTEDGLFGLTINDDVSSSDNFDIGAAIINMLTVKLDNSERKFDSKEFYGAEITVKIGMMLDSGTEWLVKGVYTADTGSESGDVITVKAYDKMQNFDESYEKSNLTFPATLGEIVRDACFVCSVELATVTFEHDDFVVQNKPKASTFRDVLSMTGQIACKWCRINRFGQLELSFYDISGYEKENGSFYEFEDYLTGSVATEDVVITGVKVTEEETAYISGEEGYLITIADNTLIQGHAEQVAGWLGEKLIGLSFRKMSISHEVDPSIEAGDLARIPDKNGNMRKTLLNSITYSYGGMQQSKTNALTPIRNSASRFSKSTKNYVKYRKLLQNYETEFDKAVESLGKRLDGASGLFETTEKQADGSLKYFLHDKPQLKDSSVIMQISSEAIAISTDGGKTWPTGITVDGEAIISILRAKGVSASWIRTGELVIQDEKGTVLFSANMDAGTVSINGDCIRIGDRKLEEVLQESKSLTLNLVPEYRTVNVDSDGKYTKFPKCEVTPSVYYGTVEITEQCSYTISKSAYIDGEWDPIQRKFEVTGLTADDAWVDIQAVYLNYTVTKRFVISKLYAGAKGDQGIQGLQGEKGDQGIPGPKGNTGPQGTDGKTYYTWMKYASMPDGSDLSDSPEYVPWLDNDGDIICDTDGDPIYIVPEEMAYIGIANNKDTPVESNNPADYTWTRFRGFDGEDGADGKDGISPTVSVSKQGTTTTITITDKDGVYTQTVEDGTDGTPGTPGEDGRTPYFHVKYSNDGGKTFTDSEGETVGSYIGTCTDYEKADPTDVKTYTWARIKGDPGEQGIPGQPGEDGKASYLHIKYSEVANPVSSNQMTETPSTYIGIYTDFEKLDSDDPSKYSWSRFRGGEGVPGKDGTDGKDGKQLYNWIKYASMSDGSDLSDSPDYVPWLDNDKDIICDTDGDPIYITPEIAYIGIAYNKETPEESENPADYVWSRFRGVDGADGTDGKDGLDGKDGKTSYTHIAYANSADGKTDFDVADSNREYIGMYVDFELYDSTNPEDYAWTKLRGADGAQGIPGKAGSDGKTPYFHIAYANSEDGTEGFDIVESADKLYIGQYTDYEKADSTDPFRYSWTRIKGDPGKNVTLDVSTTIVRKTAKNVLNPDTIVFSASYLDENEAKKSHSAIFVIEETTDNLVWKEVYRSSAAESSVKHFLYTALSGNGNIGIKNPKGYCIAVPREILAVRCSIYNVNNDLIDRQTVSVVYDITALTQEQIVNILSNDGQWKGMYYLNGHLYISFDAALGGTLTLGGVNNGNGLLRILNASGEQVGYIDNTGVNFEKGKFSGEIYGTKITGSTISGSTLSAPTINGGTITGSTVTVGGKENGNGLLKILDENGKQIGYINNTGVNFEKGKFSGELYGTKITGSTISGSTLSAPTINGGTITGTKVTVDSGSTATRIDGGNIRLKSTRLGTADESWTATSDIANAGYIQTKTRYYPDFASSSVIVEDNVAVIDLNAFWGLFIAAEKKDIASFGAGQVNLYGALSVGGDADISGDVKMKKQLECKQLITNYLLVTGTKNRVVDTENYQKQYLHAFEMPAPMFGDCGSSQLNESGEDLVPIDDILLEVINSGIEYQVFLQKEGPGDIWVEEKTPLYFSVKGTPDLKYSWEIKALQKDYEHIRFDDISVVLQDAEIENYDKDLEEMQKQELNNLDEEERQLLTDLLAENERSAKNESNQDDIDNESGR